MSECECLEPGFCPRHKMDKVGRLFEICRGTVLTPAKCAEYRAAWDRAAAGLTKQDPLACVHRGQQVGTTVCQTCAGHVEIKRFYCAIHGESELRNYLPNVVSCTLCEDRKPPEQEAGGKH